MKRENKAMKSDNNAIKRQMKKDKEDAKRQMNAMEKALKNLTANNKRAEL